MSKKRKQRTSKRHSIRSRPVRGTVRPSSTSTVGVIVAVGVAMVMGMLVGGMLVAMTVAHVMSPADTATTRATVLVEHDPAATDRDKAVFADRDKTGTNAEAKMQRAPQLSEYQLVTEPFTLDTERAGFENPLCTKNRRSWRVDGSCMIK